MTEGYLVVLELQYHGAALSDERVEELVEAVFVEADLDPAVRDPDLAGRVRDGSLDIQFVVDADDQVAASTRAFALVRSALHSLGDTTPAGIGWEPNRGLLRVAPVGEAERIVAGTP